MQAYLDHNASAPLLIEAKDAMLAALDVEGNPSSIHRAGRAVRKIIEDSRQLIADVVGINTKQVVFTSGASEAAQLCLGTNIRVGAKQVKFSQLYMSSIEHPCVLAGGRMDGEHITKFGANCNGEIDLNELESVLSHHDHAKGAPLVAAMLANNETGVIQPISRISEIVKANHGYLIVDVVQAFTKFQFDFQALGADFIFVSAHKIGGPKGAGALFIMDENISPHPLIHGGSQENLLRAGTENVAAIAGFAAAVHVANSRVLDRSKIVAMRDDMENRLEEISRQSSNETPLPQFFGKSQIRLDNTSCFAVENVKAETTLIALDLDGIAVSSGSACASGRMNQSHVLNAMGVDPDLAECAIRVSIGQQTTHEEVSYFLNSWKNIIEKRA